MNERLDWRRQLRELGDDGVRALGLDEMAALEAYGRPAYLIVPSDKHRLDAKIWKDRYPEIQVIAPEGARAKVEETVQVDTVEPLSDDPNVQFITVPVTRGRRLQRIARRRCR